MVVAAVTSVFLGVEGAPGIQIGPWALGLVIIVCSLGMLFSIVSYRRAATAARRSSILPTVIGFTIGLLFGIVSLAVTT